MHLISTESKMLNSIPKILKNLITYQKLFNKILGFGEEFLWELVLQLYYFLEY